MKRLANQLALTIPVITDELHSGLVSRDRAPSDGRSQAHPDDQASATLPEWQHVRHLPRGDNPDGLSLHQARGRARSQDRAESPGRRPEDGRRFGGGFRSFACALDCKAKAARATRLDDGARSSERPVLRTQARGATRKASAAVSAQGALLEPQDLIRPGTRCKARYRSSQPSGTDDRSNPRCHSCGLTTGLDALTTAHGTVKEQRLTEHVSLLNKLTCSSISTGYCSRIIATHDDDGITTASASPYILTSRFAWLNASPRNPVFACICPQHVCSRRNSTSTPSLSSSLTTARPVSGNNVSL